MKKFFFFATALLVSVVSLAAEPKVIFDFSDSTNVWKLPADYQKDSAAFTYGGQTISLQGGTTGDGYKFNTNQKKYSLIIGKTNAQIFLPKFNFKVSKIECIGNANASGSVVFNVFVNGTAICDAVTGCIEDHEFSIPAKYQTENTPYVIKVTSKHNLQVKKIKVYEVISGSPEKPEFSIKGGVYTEAQTVEITCATSDATISYSFDNSSFTAYSAPIEITETTTLYAKATKNKIDSDVASATYTIVSVEGDGSKENPYTVADVQKLSNKGTTGPNAWVKGFIVGCAQSGGKISTAEPEQSNLLLCTAASDTIGVPVNLPTGDIRDALNIADHPENIGAEVKVQGDLVSYFSVAGVKNTSDYVIISTPSAVENVQARQQAIKTIENGKVIVIRNGIKYTLLGSLAE